MCHASKRNKNVISENKKKINIYSPHDGKSISLGNFAHILRGSTRPEAEAKKNKIKIMQTKKKQVNKNSKPSKTRSAVQEKRNERLRKSLFSCPIVYRSVNALCRYSQIRKRLLSKSCTHRRTFQLG